jgi:drug/metabolite transporter (DMT)-like permease
LSSPRLLNTRQLLALALLTLFWGFNWPVLKLGIQHLPPVWFRLMGVVGGTVILGVYARARGISLFVPADAWWRIFALALPNLIIWFLLGIYAIALIPSSRAAILGYTMPIWAALIGVAFFGERPNTVTWVGVACATGGALLLVVGEWGALSGQPLGVGMMLAAAAIWGAGTHLLRRLRVDVNTVALTFWMMAAASAVLLLISAVFERHAWRAPQGSEWWPVLYNAVFVLGICNAIWFSLARALPPIASGLSGMLVPVVGVFSSMLLLGERPRWHDDVALVLILLSLACVVWPRQQAAAAPV